MARETLPPALDPRRFARRRAAVLVGVHLLIGLHVAHWKLAGRTLTPLELNEVMHTLELGVVTAGFLLMATAVVSVLFFGRFFCSWGCHLLALHRWHKSGVLETGDDGFLLVDRGALSRARGPAPA